MAGRLVNVGRCETCGGQMVASPKTQPVDAQNRMRVSQNAYCTNCGRTVSVSPAGGHAPEVAIAPQELFVHLADARWALEGDGVPYADLPREKQRALYDAEVDHLLPVLTELLDHSASWTLTILAAMLPHEGELLARAVPRLRITLAGIAAGAAEAERIHKEKNP
jgi:hypothetical protein